MNNIYLVEINNDDICFFRNGRTTYVGYLEKKKPTAHIYDVTQVTCDEENTKISKANIIIDCEEKEKTILGFLRKIYL